MRERMKRFLSTIAMVLGVMIIWGCACQDDTEHRDAQIIEEMVAEIQEEHPTWKFVRAWKTQINEDGDALYLSEWRQPVNEQRLQLQQEGYLDKNFQPVMP